MNRPLNQAKLVTGNILMQGDTSTPFVVRLSDRYDEEIDLTNATVTWSMANQRETVIDGRDAVIASDPSQVELYLEESDTTGYGKMKIQIIVEKDGKKQYFPAANNLDVHLTRNQGTFPQSTLTFFNDVLTTDGEAWEV